MKQRLACLAVIAVLTVSTTEAVAEQAMRLSPGGVTLQDAVRTPLGNDPARIELMRTRTLTAGTIAGTREGPLFGGSSLELGGYVEYDSDYRVDAVMRRGALSTTTDIGAGYGATVGGTDTSYRVRLGTGVTAASRGDSYFSLNPETAGDLDPEGLGRDVNLSLTLSHSFTPNLFLNGTAAARRTLGVGDSPWTQGDNQFVLGAGLGYRF